MTQFSIREFNILLDITKQIQAQKRKGL